MKQITPLNRTHRTPSHYQSVFEAFGFRPVVGARVEHTAFGEKGVILTEHPNYPGRVNVQFDNCDRESICHPLDLEFEAPDTSTTITSGGSQ